MNQNGQITIADLQAKAVELAKEHGVSVVISAEVWGTHYSPEKITPGEPSYRIHAIDKACVESNTLEQTLANLANEIGAPAMLARAEKLEAEAAKLRTMASAPEGVAA